MCGPEKDEISSMNSDFKYGKEPPRKDGGISRVCPTRRGEMLSIRRDEAGSTRYSAIRSIWDCPENSRCKEAMRLICGTSSRIELDNVK